MPRQNTSPFEHPQAVLRQIEQLGQNIVIARKRRGESQAQWARRLGISQPTMARMERGDPSVAMASYVMCIWLINPAAGLAELIAPVSDHAALEQEVAKVRARRKSIGKTKKVGAPVSPASAKDSSVSNPARTQSTSVALAASAQPLGRVQKSLEETIRAVSDLPPYMSIAAQHLKRFEDAKQAALEVNKLSTLSSQAQGIAALLAKTDPKKND